MCLFTITYNEKTYQSVKQVVNEVKLSVKVSDRHQFHRSEILVVSVKVPKFYGAHLSQHQFHKLGIFLSNCDVNFR